MSPALHDCVITEFRVSSQGHVTEPRLVISSVGGRQPFGLMIVDDSDHDHDGGADRQDGDALGDIG